MPALHVYRLLEKAFRGHREELGLVRCAILIQQGRVVMLGIAANRDEITPERIAINVDDYEIPDNAGNQPCDEPVIPGAPAAYLSTLPIKRIVTALSAANIPAEVSNSAGTYLCNHVSYAMLHHIERTGAPCRAGFIHIPQMAEAVPEGSPSLPFSTLVVGVTIALQAILGQAPR